MRNNTISKHAGTYLITTQIYIFSITFLYKVISVKYMHTTNVTGLNQKQKCSVQSWEPVVTEWCQWDQGSPPPLHLKWWSAEMHTKLPNLLCVTSDEYEWGHEYRWEGGKMNIDEGFSSLRLMVWGHWVEPINHHVATSWLTGIFSALFSVQCHTSVYVKVFV